MPEVSNGHTELHINELEQTFLNSSKTVLPEPVTEYLTHGNERLPAWQLNWLHYNAKVMSSNSLKLVLLLKFLLTFLYIMES